MDQNLANLIHQWLENPKRSYAEGVLLLKREKPSLARSIGRNEQRYSGKLIYELQKLIGLSLASQIAIGIKTPPKAKTPPAPPKYIALHSSSPSSASHIPADSQPVRAGLRACPSPDFHEDSPDILPDAPISIPNSLPADHPINIIIREHARIFALRSQLSTQRLELPPDNSPETMKKRQLANDTIHKLSDRIEQLFAARENFFTHGTIPNMELLFPPDASSQQLSLDDAIRLKRNLQEANRKDKLILDYSGNKKLSKPKPLAPSPRRTEIENRIKSRLTEIDHLDSIISELKP